MMDGENHQILSLLLKSSWSRLKIKVCWSIAGGAAFMERGGNL
jgi:hypothetical protein